MLKGTNQELVRPFNKRIVLELIRRSGPIARTEIADAVGLTVQTVSTIVRELEEEGLLLAQRAMPQGRGVPPTHLEVNPDGGFSVGIHLTPVSIEAALVNMKGSVVTSMGRDAAGMPPVKAFGIIRDLIEDLRTIRSGGRLLGVGMAMPGPFGVQTMSFVGSTTMAGWEGVDIVGNLAKATGLPAFVETDMAAAALGEQLYGIGARLTDYYYVFFDQGVGGTMVHDGSVLRGKWGNAGEVGHLTVVPDGERCPCGNSGCLERYVSLDALKRSGLSEEAWAERALPLFTRAMRMIENLFDPETIVLGGSVPAALSRRIEAIHANFGSSLSARRDRDMPRMVLSRGGAHTVLRGAAALAVRGALSPRDGQMFAPERGAA